MSQLPLLTVSAETLDAVISADGLYRYYLERRLADPLPDAAGWLCFIMLNPSTADHVRDDNTVKKCKGFALRHGFVGIRIANLFAYRTKKPTLLRKASWDGVDVVGPENDRWVRHAMTNASKVVFAWGIQGPRRERIGRTCAIAAELGVETFAIGVNNDGNPKHPLMTAYATPVTPWSADQLANP